MAVHLCSLAMSPLGQEWDTDTTGENTDDIISDTIGEAADDNISDTTGEATEDIISDTTGEATDDIISDTTSDAPEDVHHHSLCNVVSIVSSDYLVDPQLKQAEVTKHRWGMSVLGLLPDVSAGATYLMLVLGPPT